MKNKIIYTSLLVWLGLCPGLYAQVNAPGYKMQDSTLMYVNGEGTYLNLGQKEKFQFNLNGVLQPGFQNSSVDTAGSSTHSNRMSLNLVRLSLNLAAFNGMLTVGIKTDFTGTTPILEAWVGFTSRDKHHRLVLGERQTNTNNRLALEDEKFAAVLGQTLAGKSTDGTVYGGLMQNFVVTTREGGWFYEANFSINNIRFYPSVSMTTGKGQGAFGSEGFQGFKYGGRLDVMPLGDFIKNNAFISQDIYREPRPKLGIGVAGSYNVKASDPTGTGTGNVVGIYDENGTTAYANYRKLVADVIFKYKGFAFVGEYTDASISGSDLYSNAAATTKLTPEAASNKYALGSAFNVQVSYVTQNGWSLEGRYTYVTPEYNVQGSIVQTQHWYTGMVNKYLKNYMFKIGINSTYIEVDAPGGGKYSWISNLAVQLSF